MIRCCACDSHRYHAYQAKRLRALEEEMMVANQDYAEALERASASAESMLSAQLLTGISNYMQRACMPKSLTYCAPCLTMKCRYFPRRQALRPLPRLRSRDSGGLGHDPAGVNWVLHP